MAEPTVQVPVSLIERIESTTNALRHMPILSAGSGIPDVRLNLNVVTEHFNAIFAAVAEVKALLSLPTPSGDSEEEVEPCPECGGLGYDVDWADPPTQGPCGACGGSGILDPSTIRDVSSPRTTAVRDGEQKWSADEGEQTP